VLPIATNGHSYTNLTVSVGGGALPPVRMPDLRAMGDDVLKNTSFVFHSAVFSGSEFRPVTTNSRRLSEPWSEGIELPIGISTQSTRKSQSRLRQVDMGRFRPSLPAMGVLRRCTLRSITFR